MASEAIIISQIENTVGGKYSGWKIGITDKPALRKAQVGNPLSWLQWQADSHQAAKNVLQYFLQKGMKHSGTANKSADFVYIFSNT